MNTNNWIKISDRKPEFPAWLCAPGGDATLFSKPIPPSGNFMGYTHWQPAVVPAPPREPTQREKDREAVEKWARENSGSSVREIWLAALKWEREQCEQEFMQANADLERRIRSGLVPQSYDEFIRDFFRTRREGGAK